MREGRGIGSSVLTAAMVLAVAAGAAGCLGKPDLETPEPYDYENNAILINNADWGVIPLPNNFLNPVKQAEFVYIPGVAAPESVPVNMALPIIDETAAATAQALGYPVTEDGDLTKSLVTGMNRLDGWVPSFAPKIPFSKEPLYDSIVPFDGTNGGAANLFFLDITDPTAPIVITPEKYYRVVNYERRTEYPYYLSLRYVPAGMFQAPADFERGHTYAVVVTGINDDNGMYAITSYDENSDPLESTPVDVENAFLVFAAADRECPAEGECLYSTTNPYTGAQVGLNYITKLGNPANSVLTGLPVVQQAEGARQITNYVLKIWEGLNTVKDVRNRNEVVAAFQWTTMTNPTPVFFDAAAALMGGNAVVPSPADFPSGDTVTLANAGCNPSIGFRFNTEVALDTVTPDTVKVYAVSGDTEKTLVEVPVTVTPTTTDGVTSVIVKTNEGTVLTANTQYLVVATNGIMNVSKTRTAVDETYFGLTRVGLPTRDSDGNVTGFSDLPLVSDDGQGGKMWNSPNLDSRLDTLILNHVIATGTIDSVDNPMTDITDAALVDAKDGGFGVMKVLNGLEGLRAMHKALFDAVVLDTGLVQAREDIVLGWTFTTGACN